jgi:hypothetical protein
MEGFIYNAFFFSLGILAGYAILFIQLIKGEFKYDIIKADNSRITNYRIDHRLVSRN